VPEPGDEAGSIEPGSGDHASIKTLLATHRVLGLRHHVVLVIVAVGLLAVDWATKQIVLHHLRSPVHIVGTWLQLQLLSNPGAAFSLGEGFTVFFACLGLVALVVLVFLVAPRVSGRLPNVVVGLLIAGVAGNLGDRLFRYPGPFHGYVIDWIGLRYFAVFNVADMCITAAAVVIIVALLRTSLRER